MKKVTDREGNEFYINEIPSKDSCIISNTQINKREDLLDEHIQDWYQPY